MSEDQLVLRDALAYQFKERDDFDVIAVAANGQETIEKLEIGTIPDILLLDLAMPVLGGYDTAKYVCSKFPNIKVVILTMFASEISFIRLLRVGVKGFLKKNMNPAEMKRALIEIAQGGYFYCDKDIGKFTEIIRDSTEHFNSLKKSVINETEIKFLQLAATDLTYKAVAEIMGMSHRKIDHIRDNLFLKLGVESRVGLAMFAVKNALVGLD